MNLSSHSRSRVGRRANVYAIAGVLMATTFGIGLLIAGYFLLRWLLVMMVIGLLGFASLQTAAVVTTLQSGNSKQRLEVLTHLEETLCSSNASASSSELESWLSPGLDACLTDPDPEVRQLADDLRCVLSAQSYEAASLP